MLTAAIIVGVVAGVFALGVWLGQRRPAAPPDPYAGYVAFMRQKGDQ